MHSTVGRAFDRFTIHKDRSARLVRRNAWLFPQPLAEILDRSEPRAVLVAFRP